VEVSRIIMFIIASTLFVCAGMVIAFKGVHAMPYTWVGVVGAVIFMAGALAMTRVGH
jgi:hypothetical protein